MSVSGWKYCSLGERKTVHHAAHTAVLRGKEITECKTMFEKENAGHYNGTRTTFSNTAGLGTAALLDPQAAVTGCLQ